MATVNWSAFTDRGNFAGTILNSLADATLSAASSELDNATNKDTHALLEINLGSLNPTGSPYLEIYMVKAPDGTNYEEAPIIGGDNRNTLVTTIPVPTGTAAKRVMTPYMIPLPPCKVKFYIGNQLNVTTASTGNSLDIYTANLTSA